METMVGYLIWLIITSIWSSISDDSKEAVIARYCITFVIYSTMLYVINVIKI